MKHSKFLTVLGSIIYPRNYYGMLAALLIVAMAAPLTVGYVWGHLFLCLSMSAILLLGSVTISQNDHGGYFVFFIALAASLVWSASGFFTGQNAIAISLEFVSNLIAIIFLGITASAILRDVFNHEVNANRICGAIVVYMLAGLCFAIMQLNVILFDPNAFSFSAALQNSPGSLEIGSNKRFSLMIYFSFCTITTVGYGDVTPVNAVARNLAWVEAMTGQLYLTVLVARLVGLHIMKRPAQVSEDYEEQVTCN